MATDDRITDVRQNPSPLPAPRRYRTLLADPPWNLNQYGTRPPPYRLLSVERMAALPVAGLAASDAHLWLRVTNASIFASKTVMEA